MFDFKKVIEFSRRKKPNETDKVVYWVNLYDNGQALGYKTLHRAKKRKSAIARVKVEFQKGQFDGSQ